MATFTLRNHPIGSLSTGKWPDRVRPMLCIERGNTALDTELGNILDGIEGS